MNLNNRFSLKFAPRSSVVYASSSNKNIVPSAPFGEYKVLDMDLEKRIRMAAESILENESLLEGLEEGSAAAVLDWGLARAKQIAGETAVLTDETDAEDAMDPRMRALRQLLRIAARIGTENIDPGERAPLFAEVCELFEPQSGQAPDKINAFRLMIETDPSKREMRNV